MENNPKFSVINLILLKMGEFLKKIKEDIFAAGLTKNTITSIVSGLVS